MSESEINEKVECISFRKSLYKEAYCLITIVFSSDFTHLK